MFENNNPENSFHDFKLEKFLEETLGIKLTDGKSLGSKTKTIAEFFSLDLLEGELGLSKGFFNELLDENDWSFIINLFFPPAE